MAKQSLGAQYFDQLYDEHEDPWNFAASAYELAKYEVTLQALGTNKFRNALEIGCSIGVLSEQLSSLCEHLLSVDISARAVARARQRCKNQNNIEFACMAVPQAFPVGTFDLIVISEVAYYWSDADLALAVDKIADAAPGGTVELVHFLPKVAEYLRDGDSAHAAFLASPRYVLEHSQRAERYRLDILRIQ